MYSLKDTLEVTDPLLWGAIREENTRQEDHIELIASENYVSPAVLEAQGSILTNKYAEGYPGKRYYGGCQHVDTVEQLAIDRAKELFGAEFVNVQPHSGSQANQAVFYSVLNAGDTVMGMSLDHGGHLTHGASVNISGKLFKSVSYGLNPETELMDYDQAEKVALEFKPKLIVCGASAYSRVIDWQRFRDIADKVGAYLMADIAHYAGLVAAGLYPSPVGIADFVTSTTHKTLRGPRGGMIMAKGEHGKMIDSMIFPGIQGGPLMHVIAGKAVAYREALQPSFRTYIENVLKNTKVMAETLVERGFRIISGGTDAHVFLVDLRDKGIKGKPAADLLGSAHITVNKNSIPNDPESAFITSGIRIGGAAITTRGFTEDDARATANLIADVIENPNKVVEVRDAATALCRKHPVYGD